MSKATAKCNTGLGQVGPATRLRTCCSWQPLRFIFRMSVFDHNWNASWKYLPCFHSVRHGGGTIPWALRFPCVVDSVLIPQAHPCKYADHLEQCFCFCAIVPVTFRGMSDQQLARCTCFLVFSHRLFSIHLTLCFCNSEITLLSILEIPQCPKTSSDSYSISCAIYDNGLICVGVSVYCDGWVLQVSGVIIVFH